MSLHYTAFLLAFLVLFAVLLVRYVDCAVDREFRTLARAAEDGDFRKGEIRRLNGLLAGQVPLPPDTPALPRPPDGWRRAHLTALLAVGAILLWGAGAAPAGERVVWLIGGGLPLLAAFAIMVFSLSRRRMASCARLLLLRANLRRLDGDREGAASDVEEALRLTPWDDAAWSELADDRAATGETGPALEAMERALALDPGYEEYHLGAASLALQAGLLERAGKALHSWRSLDPDGEGDPRIPVYRAALALARDGKDGRTEALDILGEAGGVFADGALEEDPALGRVREIVPERWRKG